MKPYVCNDVNCYKRYKNLNGLKYHIEKSHGFNKAEANQIATDIVKKTNARYGINARSVPATVLFAAIKEHEQKEKSTLFNGHSKDKCAFEDGQSQPQAQLQLQPPPQHQQQFILPASDSELVTAFCKEQVAHISAATKPVSLAPKSVAVAPAANTDSKPHVLSFNHASSSSSTGACTPSEMPKYYFSKTVDPNLPTLFIGPGSFAQASVAAVAASSSSRSPATVPPGSVPNSIINKNGNIIANFNNNGANGNVNAANINVVNLPAYIQALAGT
jgi:hypothetical protein